MMECLKNIVGVTISENDCIISGLTTDERTEIKKSTSGLYLDDLPGGVHMKALKTVDATKGFYAMATGAISNAIRSLEDDLIVALNKNYNKTRKNFIGQIGRMSFAQSLATTANLQGMRIRPTDYSDAVVNISKITLIDNLSASLNVYVLRAPYLGDAGEIIKTYPITTVANAYTTIQIETADNGLKLPMVYNGELVEYWIYWNRTEAGGAVPKDNKIACSTCPSSNALKLVDFLDVRGVGFSDITDLKGAQVDEYSHGLTLDAVIKCDNEKLFCGQYNDEDAVATVMAKAVQFKGGELLIEEVLKSPDVNRYTTMAREYLWGKRNHFRTEYESRIVYLADTIDIKASNCYVCREQPNQPFMSGIYS